MSLPPLDLAALLDAAGLDFVADDWELRPDELAFFAQDVFAEGQPLLAVLQPGDVDTLARCVRGIVAAGHAVISRGGGLSYTQGYLADRPGAVLVDTRRLNRVLEINTVDRYVRVQAGVTWAQLDGALESSGLRTPFWGPLSGIGATVGGTISQGSAFLGSGVHGSVADSVLALEVVTAAGSRLRTGAWAASAGAPFFRYSGPDLTGLLSGDCGSLGIKTEASLRLLPRPPAVDFLSFQCADAARQIAAMSAVARLGVAAECFGFDPVLAQMRLRRASLMGDAKTLGRVLQKDGLRGGLRLIGAGRRFLDPDSHSLHLSIEGDDTAMVAARMRSVRQALRGLADEIESSIPRVLRSAPFAPPNSMLGPAGERWVPVHGIVPHSAAGAAHAELQALFAGEETLIRRHAITISYLMATVGAQGFLIEPVFYWPDSHSGYHRRMVQPEYLARCGEAAAENLPARNAVAALRRAAADLLHAHGAVHFQLGGFYDYRQGRDPQALALFDAIKLHLDPRGLMNPGVLR